MNFADHAPPHVHIKYQGDVRSYRIEMRSQRWMRSARELPDPLKGMVEAWVEAHQIELMEQWENARRGLPVEIVG